MSKQIVIRTVAAVALAHAATEVARSQGVVLRAPVRTVSWRKTVQPAIAAGQPWRQADIAASAAVATDSTTDPAPAPSDIGLRAAPTVTPTPVAARAAGAATDPIEMRAPLLTAVPTQPTRLAPVPLVLAEATEGEKPARRAGRWKARRLVAGAIVPVAAAGLLIAGFAPASGPSAARTATLSAGVAPSAPEAPSFIDPLERPAVTTPAWATSTLPPATIPPAPSTTVVAVPAPTPAPAAVTVTTAARPTGYGEVLHCIRQIESTQNYGAVSPSGKYRGAYQFDQPTWNGNAPAEWVGHDPATVPPAGQDQAAITLIQRRGLQPWPTPNRKCGHLLPG